LIIAALATTLVLLMYWYNAPVDVQNGFTRVIATNKASKIKTIYLGSENHYFAGWTNHALYLGDIKRPFQLLVIRDTATDTIDITNQQNNAILHSRITVDASLFQLADLNRFDIYRGQVGVWSIANRVHSERLFSEELLTGNNSIVVRDLNSQGTQYTLSKETCTPFSRETAENLIEKQIDGLFCTDGMLRFDRTNFLIVYTYFYRNQFFVADTSLNLRLRGHTIDTVSTADIKVASVSSEGYRTIASPPKIVNRNSYAHDGKLYVNSNLKADNEDWKTHRRSDVIDVYNLFSGKYEYSFYIDRENGKRLRHFYVQEKSLYILRDDHLVIYTLT